MKNREQIKKSLEACSDVYYGCKSACSGCSYGSGNGGSCFSELIHDTVELLKNDEMEMQSLAELAVAGYRAKTKIDLLMEEKDITQRELAEAIGVSDVRMSLIASGKKEMKPLEMLNLMMFFDCKPSDLR